MQNITINKQLLHIIISIIAAFLFYQLNNFLVLKTQIGLFRIFGTGSYSVITLKILMYIGFCYGILELLEKRKNLLREYGGFELGLLPTQEQMVLSPAQVEDIKILVLQRQKNGTYYKVLDFIKKACTQFRNNQDISEMLHVLDTQFDSNQNQDEGDIEIIRYIVNTIPMLGMVATVVELSGSLVLIEEYIKTENIKPLVTALYSAFDGTVAGLILAMILTFFYHQHIGEVDVFYGKMKAYLVDNLISRIFKGK